MLTNIKFETFQQTNDL